MTERLPSKSFPTPTDSMSLRTKMTRRMELVLFSEFVHPKFEHLDLNLFAASCQLPCTRTGWKLKEISTVDVLPMWPTVPNETQV